MLRFSLGILLLAACMIGHAGKGVMAYRLAQSLPFKRSMQLWNSMKPGFSHKDKIRVKLLDNVKDIGDKGTIAMVGRTVWLNVLQPKRQAVLISDQQLATMERDAQLAEKKKKSEMEDLHNLVSGLPAITIARKMGPTKKIFGSVSGATLLEHLAAALPDKFRKVLIDKNTFVTSIMELSESGSPIGTSEISDIRNCGLFEVAFQVDHQPKFLKFKVQVVPAT